MSENSTIEEQLLREQMRLVFRQTRTAGLGNMVIAASCAGLSRANDLPWYALVPFVLVAMVQLSRLWGARQFARDEMARTPSQWSARTLRESLLAGVSWGLVGVCTYPSAPIELKMLLMIVACGLNAAAVATLSALRPAFLAYLVPFMVGMTVSTALFFPRYGAVAGTLMGFYMLVMVRTSREQSAAVVQSLRLALENKALLVHTEEARARAEHANQAKSQFLARMSHEIRTPLNGILGVHELLLTSRLGSDERRFIETAHQSGSALLSIINDVLDFSKIEAGKVELHPEPFKVERLLEELMAIFAVATHRKGLHLAYELDARAPVLVRGDELRLRQVLTNLLGNAIKFTARGSITLRIKAGSNGRLRFGVTDSGIGISEASRARIFQSFAQADVSITRRYGGTGLGLAISRQLVELMGGALEVTSEEGQGAEFHFEADLPGVAMELPASSLQGAGRRAVVELAHEGSRDTIVGWLRAAGFEVEPGAAKAEGGALLITDVAPRGPATARVPTVVVEQTLSLSEERRADPRLAHVTFPLIRSGLEAAALRVLSGEVAATAPAPVAQWSSKRVLVVDDDAINRTIARAMLGRLGCETLVLARGDEALEAMASERFDLVLMDCEMPDVDGLTVTREQRRRERSFARDRVPVVALTAHATEAQRELCLAAEMDEMVSKPLSLSALEGCLTRWATAN
ncbi:MAG: ATP-binding protein [Archangium sp.]|nr:ATP-binding protein [Archangium sp.]MDP3153722.1 ATP-binding protein [Archangium sp.]MDP3569229.1 ATP-binding protein [Archangium sp.]